MSTRVVRMNQVVAAQFEHGAREPQRLHAPPLLARGDIQRSILTRQQSGFDALGGKPLDQAQHLPLPPAHHPPRIQMKDPHQFGRSPVLPSCPPNRIRINSYFSLWSISETCKMPTYKK